MRFGNLFKCRSWLIDDTFTNAIFIFRCNWYNFIAFNFSLKYAILTGLSTNLLLAVLFGPLAIPFSLVSVTVALVANLCAKKEVTYERAIIIGILLAAIGALVRHLLG